MRLNTIRQCHDRLVDEGVDLSAFASADAAEDLEDLRVALGVDQWNLVVGEYGSMLAQIVVRDHPEGVRSVVVNSTPVPLQADWFGILRPTRRAAGRPWSPPVKPIPAVPRPSPSSPAGSTGSSPISPPILAGSTRCSSMVRPTPRSCSRPVDCCPMSASSAGAANSSGRCR